MEALPLIAGAIFAIAVVPLHAFLRARRARYLQRVEYRRHLIAARRTP